MNLGDGAIEIRETKFFKHRRLPLPEGVTAAIRNYLLAREQAGAPAAGDSSFFWNQKFGRDYSYGGLSILFVEVLRRAGLKPAIGGIEPRIHDLRHTMVGHRMREWYREYRCTGLLAHLTGNRLALVGPSDGSDADAQLCSNLAPDQAFHLAHLSHCLTIECGLRAPKIAA